MKKAYLVHGWDGSPESNFFPWLKSELESQGFKVTVPEMPETNYPKIEKWVPHLQSVISDPDSDTILLGHSMGCQAVLRYLEALPENIKVGKVIMVAGVIDRVTNLEGSDIDIVKPWIETLIDPEKVKRSTNQIVGIFSDNDKWIPLESAQVFEEKYGARIVIEHEMNHFSQESGVTEFPNILNEILK